MKSPSLQEPRLRRALLVFAALNACSSQLAQHTPANLEAVASGFYATVPPKGENGPSDASGEPVTPKVSATFTGLPQTNDWWSSLIWSYKTGKDRNPYSEPMFPHPLSAQAEARGLRIGYTTTPVVDGRGYYFPHRAELLIGVAGLHASDTRVGSYGDWTVTAEWRDEERSLALTLGHGLPFVYATRVHGRARVEATAPLEIWHHEKNVAALTVNGHHYALFAPRGASWQVSGAALESDLGSRDFYSVAVLPDRSPETLELFRRHSSAFVRGSRVSYRYDRRAARLTSRFELEVEQKEPEAPSSPLLALYRHQWLHTSERLTALSYVSPRGEMKLLEGAAFETSLPVSGLLPSLPDRGAYDRDDLRGYLKLAANDDFFEPGLEGTRDSYWEGKSFGKLSGLVHVADQLGETAIRDDFLDGIRRELEDWFDGQPPRYFYRNETWKTLIGVPTMYHSGAQLNDHHFHYGYYVMAAATVARFDRAWAEKWAPFVEQLIRDAGSWQRDDAEYPFLRYFDVYAGHSWASGTTFFEAGNNEESSSEDMNFAAAVTLWGETMQRPEIRDAGLFLYTQATEAFAQYWYDVDRAVYPKGFQHPAVGIVWGSGAAYDTWFSPLPEFIHGIQLTPMLTGSLWLGKHPAAIERVYRHVEQQSDGSVHLWRDLFWMLVAQSDADRAARWFEAEHYFEPEFGNSMAYTYHFIETLRALGRLSTSVHADTPLYAVFEKGDDRTYVAYNAAAQPVTVRFSDGARLELAARTLGSRTAEVR